MTRLHATLDGDVDLLALHASGVARYPYLLESAASGTEQGRYDILFALPRDSLCLDAGGRLAGESGRGGDFLDALDGRFAAERRARREKPVPFESGWFVFLGYELAGQVEPTLSLAAPRCWPIAFATRVGGAVVRDRLTGQVSLCADSEQEMKVMRADIAALRTRRFDLPLRLVDQIEEDPPARYIDAVEHAKRHIHAGDIYQANLSREWRASLHGPVTDEALYRRLSETNPGSFAGLAHWRGNAIISSSPERLVAVRDRAIETRPIAGTRPRGRDAAHDAALVRELIDHPKERAEHIMLIDLERNDLGRVCEAGTVEVDEYMALESYAHVHHIVSNVRGRLRDEVTPGAAIRAVFPGGTITGCPKVRCMQLIAELEPAPRGAYTGSMGYLDLDGDCDLNILIRTLVRTGREISLRAGAGIVADSVAEREVAETRAKARGLLLALGAQT